VAARKQFPLRIDPALWAVIEAMAAEELRSVNAQVEVLLREAVRRRGRSVPRAGESAPAGSAGGDA